MAAARAELKLTQKDLAQKVNEKPSVMQEYESGKAIPSVQILGKLERILGVRLRGTVFLLFLLASHLNPFSSCSGSNIGEKLGGPKKSWMAPSFLPFMTSVFVVRSSPECRTR